MCHIDRCSGALSESMHVATVQLGHDNREGIYGIGIIRPVDGVGQQSEQWRAPFIDKIRRDGAFHFGRFIIQPNSLVFVGFVAVIAEIWSEDVGGRVDVEPTAWRLDKRAPVGEVARCGGSQQNRRGSRPSRSCQGT
jgi:hypothetical protein